MLGSRPDQLFRPKQFCTPRAPPVSVGASADANDCFRKHRETCHPGSENDVQGSATDDRMRHTMRDARCRKGGKSTSRRSSMSHSRIHTKVLHENNHGYSATTAFRRGARSTKVTVMCTRSSICCTKNSIGVRDKRNIPTSSVSDRMAWEIHLEQKGHEVGTLEYQLLRK